MLALRFAFVLLLAVTISCNSHAEERTAAKPAAPVSLEITPDAAAHPTVRIEPRTPQEALDRLKAGNARFVAGRMTHPDENLARLNELRGGQHPFAAVVGCSDSRVPPELLFDEGFGDLFVIRVAGNVYAGDVAASVEYAVEHLHVPLVIVLGHENCGAVGAAFTGAVEPEPELAHLLSTLGSQAHVSECDCLDEAITRNAQATADELSKLHAVVEARKKREVRVVAGVYSMTERTVKFVEPKDESEMSAKRPEHPDATESGATPAVD